MSLKSKGELTSRSVVSQKWTFLLCLGCFCAGMLFTNRYVYQIFIHILKGCCLWDLINWVVYGFGLVVSIFHVFFKLNSFKDQVILHLYSKICILADCSMFQ